MTWGGAAGGTAQDMAAALRFSAPQATLHQEWDALDLALTAHAAAAGFELHIVNQVWGKKTTAFYPVYKAPYHKLRRAAAFTRLYQLARSIPGRQINAWVGSQTQQEIQNLIRRAASITLPGWF